MLDAGWGRVVNISSAIAAHPDGMVRGNAYATTKAALEAHTVNLAAELPGTGPSVSTPHRPRRGVDTAMQAMDPPSRPRSASAPACTERFNRNYAEGSLITPGHSAAALLTHLAGDDTGVIWDVTTPRAGTWSARPRPCVSCPRDPTAMASAAGAAPPAVAASRRPAPQATGRGRAR